MSTSAPASLTLTLIAATNPETVLSNGIRALLFDALCSKTPTALHQCLGSPTLAALPTSIHTAIMAAWIAEQGCAIIFLLIRASLIPSSQVYMTNLSATSR